MAKNAKKKAAPSKRKKKKSVRATARTGDDVFRGGDRFPSRRGRP